jgi:hypothetical protein
MQVTKANYDPLAEGELAGKLIGYNKVNYAKAVQYTYILDFQNHLEKGARAGKAEIE